MVTGFVRYADDSQIYVASERAGRRVMTSVTRFVEQRLKLRVNAEKSALAPAWERPFLGFRFFRARDETVKIAIDPRALKRARERLHRLTGRSWGISMERRIELINRFTVSWTAYFYIAETPSKFEDLDKWLRRRLRQVRWKEWKRRKTRYRNMRALGVPELGAYVWSSSRKGPWHLSRAWPLQMALTNAYWHKTMGLEGFTKPYRRLRER